MTRRLCAIVPTLTIASVLPALGAAPVTAATVAPDSREVLVVSQTSGPTTSVVTIDARDGQRRQFTTSDGAPAAGVTAVSRGGDRVLPVEGDPLDISGRSSKYATGGRSGFGIFSQDISPDGIRVVNLDTNVGLVSVAPPDGVSEISYRTAQGETVQATFLTADLLLLKVTRSSGPVWLTVATKGGATAPVTGLDPAATGDVVVSHDGASIAYVRRVATGTQVERAPITIQGTQLTVGSPVVLTSADTSRVDSSPAFSLDDGIVYLVRRETATTRQDLFSVPAAGGTAQPFGPSTTEDETSVDVGRIETTAPAAPTSFTAAPYVGRIARLTLALPDDASASYVRITRTAPDRPATTLTARLPRGARSAVPVVADDAYLDRGTSYRYEARVVDRSGNIGPVVASSTALEATRVRSGDRVTRTDRLTTSNGNVFRVQKDGNMVTYDRAGKVLWQSRTRGGDSLVVQADGNLVLYAGSRVVWQTRTAGNGDTTLRLQNDGNLVLQRDRDGRVVWSSRTGKR